MKLSKVLQFDIYLGII